MSTPKPGSKRPTLSEVAAHAEVSLPTVSKVVHGHRDVAPATRARVQASLHGLGYVPRTPRVAVHGRRSIEVMADQLTNPYTMEVLHGITLAAEELEVDIVLSKFHSVAAGIGSLRPDKWARRLLASGRSGVIVLTAEVGGEHTQWPSQEHLPIVAIDPLDATAADIPSVGSTNWAGGWAATNHLIELGHTNVAAIGGKSESLAAAARVHGFRAACGSAGLSINEALIEFTGYDYDSGLEVADRWFARGDRPSAIFSASDTQAMGVLEAARRYGLRVPDDLSVVAYDDTYIARWATPPLTSIRQPLHQMGKVALRSVLRLAEGHALDAQHIELATELVVRASTTAPKQQA